MKKILIVANKMECGGTEIAALSIINELLKNKENEISLLLYKAEGVWLNRIPKAIKVYEYVGPRNLKEVMNSLNGIHKIIFILKYLIRRIFFLENYDLLIQYTPNWIEEYDLALDVNGYSYLLTAYLAQKIKSTKKATWFHDEDLSWLFKIKKYLPLYDKLYCVSKAVKEKLVSEIPNLEKNIEVLYNPIDILRIRKMATEEYDNIFQKNVVNILTVGRIHPQKGIEMILDTAVQLKKHKISFMWHLIGDGDKLPEYQKMSIKKGISELVKFWGRRDNPYPYIANCDIYVQPSLHEGYGLTVLEARVLKKLIVATDLPCFREQIVNGENGILVSIDAISLADKLEEIIRNGISSYQYLAQAESEIDFTNQILKIYELLN